MPHNWIYPIRVGYAPGVDDPFIEQVVRNLLHSFAELGHTVIDRPEDRPHLLLTSAMFGESLNWRKAYMFTARKRLRLDYTPTVVTLTHATPGQHEALVTHFSTKLAGEDPRPEDYPFPGLAPLAYQTLFEQGRRGGAMMAIARLVQVWTKSIRSLLVIGEDEPVEAYLFDLVGAHPRVSAGDVGFFYPDLANRLATVVCTRELVSHEVVGQPLTLSEWQALKTPGEMRAAGLQLGERNFFTEMVRVERLAAVPALDGVVASQYSEGCFATWDLQIDALVATITGSARPVEKARLTDDELAVIVGLRPDGLGAQVREVAGKRNDPPSSEAVEMLLLDRALPKTTLRSDLHEQDKISLAPVVRSKLHGHRGVSAFDPGRVEHVFLDLPYYDYPVSCSTEAQAWAIQAAFARSEALNDPTDPRQVVFTILPGHGVLIVEKWVPGLAPFQVIWEMIDRGAIQIANPVPQGRLDYLPGADSRLNLVEPG